MKRPTPRGVIKHQFWISEGFGWKPGTVAGPRGGTGLGGGFANPRRLSLNSSPGRRSVRFQIRL